MEERLKYSDKAKEDLQYWKKTNNVARAMPSTYVLTKLANALNVSTEYLLNGTNEDFANEILIDKELLKQFKSIEVI